MSSHRRFIRRRAELDGRWVDYLLHDQARVPAQRQAALAAGHALVRRRPSDPGDHESIGPARHRGRLPHVRALATGELLQVHARGVPARALIDYQIEPEDPTRTIPNPERRALDKAIRAARADLAKLEREYGAAAANSVERCRPTMRGFKIAHGRLGKQLRTARARVVQLFEQRRGVAKRVEVRDLNERTVVKLATERKHLTDIIKMVAYQAESDLLALLRPHYARADQEGRTLLHELFATAGDIRVSGSELHITLAPLSSPTRTHAAQALCEVLDHTATIFPGSRLRVRFAVRPPPHIGLAFPGSPVERSAATAVASAP
jgi:hypothetical protein